MNVVVSVKRLFGCRRSVRAARRATAMSAAVAVRYSGEHRSDAVAFVAEQRRRRREVNLTADLAKLVGVDVDVERLHAAVADADVGQLVLQEVAEKLQLRLADTRMGWLLQHVEQTSDEFLGLVPFDEYGVAAPAVFEFTQAEVAGVVRVMLDPTYALLDGEQADARSWVQALESALVDVECPTADPDETLGLLHELLEFTGRLPKVLRGTLLFDVKAVLGRLQSALQMVEGEAERRRRDAAAVRVAERRQVQARRVAANLVG